MRLIQEAKLSLG